MISTEKWKIIRPLFDDAFKSSVHFAMATVNEDGSPDVTPIGSLILREDPSGFFFDEFCGRSRENLDRNPGVCFLAVNAQRAFWIRSVIIGKFAVPPAIRLIGTVSPLREASPEEVKVWQSRLNFARGTRGYKIMWSTMHLVRDVKFDSFEPVNCGSMNSGLL